MQHFFQAEVTLQTSHIGKGCDRDTYNLASQRHLCGASGLAVDLLPDPQQVTIVCIYFVWTPCSAAVTTLILWLLAFPRASQKLERFSSDIVITNITSQCNIFYLFYDVPSPSINKSYRKIVKASEGRCNAYFSGLFKTGTSLRKVNKSRDRKLTKMPEPSGVSPVLCL